MQRWLENYSGWLLVFDNADEPGLLEDYIPIDQKGHILLTSRAQLFDNLGISKQVELPKMPPGEAREFLLKRTVRSDMSQSENEAILKIAEELDHLPLALEQAGAFITELKAGFSNFLSSYRTRGLDMFKKTLPVTGKYPKSVATTWLLNFEQVEKTSKASADLLTASAFLNPDNIPLELIIKGAPELGETISTAIEGIEKDPIVIHELLLPLTRYSLITRDASAYSVHRLVQAVIRDRIGKDAERVWAERIVKAMNCAFPAVEFSNGHLCERLGVPIKDLPVAASAAEWVTEKAAAIGTGAVALGVTVRLGVTPPVLGSSAVVSLLTQKSEELFGGKFIVEIDPVRASQLLIEHITEARKKLGLAV